MAKAREIRRRIRSVENTRQITRTMEMVATSKLKRATDRFQMAGHYARELERLVRTLAPPAPGEEAHPLLRRPEAERRAAVLLVTANRGLCGGFNANLIRQAGHLLERLGEGGVETELHVVGRKGITFFRFRGVALATARTDVGEPPTVENAGSILAPLRKGFEAGRYDAVYVVSAEFRSALSTPPRVNRLLPLEPDGEGHRADRFLLSPGAERILEALLPLYVRNRVYVALVESAVAEQAARRTAMKNATDNAGEMIDVLRRTYNRARQAQITQEIAEIVGGAEALT